MHTVEIEHSMLVEMVRNDKYQFAASNKELESMKVEPGDILLLDILHYDDYFDTHPVNVFIDGYGDKVVVMKNMVFEVVSIVPLPGSDDSVVNMKIASTLGGDLPMVADTKKPVGLPTDYL